MSTSKTKRQLLEIDRNFVLQQNVGLNSKFRHPKDNELKTNIKYGWNTLKKTKKQKPTFACYTELWPNLAMWLTCSSFLATCWLGI